MDQREGDGRQNDGQGRALRSNGRDFIREQYNRQQRLKIDREAEKSQGRRREWRVRNLQTHFKVYDRAIKTLMHDIGELPHDVQTHFEQAEQKYQKLQNDFDDVFTNSNQLVARATHHPIPYFPAIERSTRNINEDRLRDAVHQLHQFHQELNSRVQTEKLKITRDQLQQQIRHNQDLTQQNEGLTERNQYLTQQNEGLTERNQDLTRQNEDLTQEVKKMIQKADKDAKISAEKANLYLDHEELYPPDMIEALEKDFGSYQQALNDANEHSQKSKASDLLNAYATLSNAHRALSQRIEQFDQYTKLKVKEDIKEMAKKVYYDMYNDKLFLDKQMKYIILYQMRDCIEKMQKSRETLQTAWNKANQELEENTVSIKDLAVIWERLQDVDEDLQKNRDEFRIRSIRADLDSALGMELFRDPEQPDRIDIEPVLKRDVFSRDFEVASVLDFPNLANKFDEAIQLGKPPEDVYQVLYYLQCEPEAIEALNDAYAAHSKNGRTLEDALRDRFGGPGMKYALQLINIPELPGTSSLEVYEASDRLKKALEAKNPEAIYAVVTPFQRSTPFLYRLGEAYKRYGSELRTDIEASLKEQERSLDHALFLLGEEKMERHQITPYEADRLFTALSRLTFDAGYGVRLPVPYDDPGYIKGGCSNRAHMVAEALKEMGIGSKKIFAFSIFLEERPGVSINEWPEKSKLRLQTDLGPDMPFGTKKTIEWQYHTAICIPVEMGVDDTQLFVLDASLSDRRLPPEDWIAKMTEASSFEFITISELKEKMVTESSRRTCPDGRCYPTDQTYWFTTSRNSCGRPTIFNIDALSQKKPIPGQDAFTEYAFYGKKEMIDSTENVLSNRLARHIRRNIKDFHDEATAQEFLEAIEQAPPRIRLRFREVFPLLYSGLKAQFVPSKIKDLEALMESDTRKTVEAKIPIG